MNGRNLKGILIAALLIPLLVMGCGKSGDQTVATVGDYEITADEFDKFFSQVRLAFASAQEEYDKRREFLDTMIVTRLAIQGAYELNIDKVEDLARTVVANQNRFLIMALYNKHISSKSEPTDAEIRDFYNRLENRIRASHILIRDADTAQTIFERVKNGENFEQLAYEFSFDPDAKRNKGDLGYLLWGATVDEFQEVAFGMEPGEISPPVKSRFGYHIIKLVEKLPNENRGDFESMEASIKNQLFRRKAMNLTEEYFNAAKVKYPIVIDTATLDYILHKREQLYPPQVLATLPRNDFDPEALDRNEKELVVATWAGGQVTLVEYLTLLKNIPNTMWPSFDQYDSLAIVVFEMKKNDILTAEALAEGLDNDEEYLSSLRMFKEFNMADIMKNDSIPVPAAPEEEDLRKYYEENLDEFTTPAKIHIHEILLSDEMKASKLAREIRSLQVFEKTASELTERPGKRSRNGDMGYIEEKWYPEIFEVAQKTNVGRVGGPVPTVGKYSIIYVVDKIDPEVKAFLEVKRIINDKLVKQQKNEAIQTWVDNRLKTTVVDVDEDALWSTIDMSKYAQADSTGA